MACREDIVELINEQRIANSIIEITSNLCNIAYIDNLPSLCLDQPFVFIAYTHGSENGLVVNGNSFVSRNNSHYFKDSLFYSTACLVGKGLAMDLIGEGCKAFVGFSEESEVFAKSHIRKIFIDCDNYALKMFLTTNATIGDSVKAAKQYYSSKIDKLLEFKENVLFVSALVNSRDSLICEGNKDLIKEDLFIN